MRMTSGLQPDVNVYSMSHLSQYIKYLAFHRVTFWVPSRRRVDLRRLCRAGRLLLVERSARAEGSWVGTALACDVLRGAQRQGAGGGRGYRTETAAEGLLH